MIMAITNDKPKAMKLAWNDVDEGKRDIAALTEYLAANNGITGLEVLTVDDVERAVQVFRRDGFVVIRDVLTPEQLAFVRSGVTDVAEQIVALDPTGKGNRMAHRYSFGGCSSTRSQLHRPEWQLMLELPFVHQIMAAIFESDAYMLRAASGDFCMPGAHGYQPLHSDMRDFTPDMPSPYSSFHDPRGHLNTRDMPSPYVAMNFLTVDATPLNGPTRQIPGTHNSRAAIPTLAEEPEWMRLSTVCPAPAGSIQIRDVRAWHGGTPNVSGELRAIPNLEFYAPWFREPVVSGINRAAWEQLGDTARKVTQFTVADSSDPIEPTLALNAPY
jgi:ectoine hydroxylase-related dioxygenase (phytanoyl-CoA dioxygenase family)